MQISSTINRGLHNNHISLASLNIQNNINTQVWNQNDQRWFQFLERHSRLKSERILAFIVGFKPEIRMAGKYTHPLHVINRGGVTTWCLCIVPLQPVHDWIVQRMCKLVCNMICCFSQSPHHAGIVFKTLIPKRTWAVTCNYTISQHIETQKLDAHFLKVYSFVVDLCHVAWNLVTHTYMSNNNMLLYLLHIE